MTGSSLQNAPLYQRIYAVVQQIPPGQVATYGQIARLVGGCSAQMVGFAMAALPHDTEVPWQRVINRQGQISLRDGGAGSARQRQLLEAEGISFNADNAINFAEVGWPGPDWQWATENGFFLA